MNSLERATSMKRISNSVKRALVSYTFPKGTDLSLPPSQERQLTRASCPGIGKALQLAKYGMAGSWLEGPGLTEVREICWRQTEAQR